MRASSFTFHPPLLSASDSSHSRPNDNRPRHPGYAMPGAGLLQQPGDQGPPMNLPFHGLQATPVPLAVPAAGTYGSTARSMPTWTPGFPMEPSQGATHASLPYTASYPYVAPYPYSAPSPHMVTPSHMATPSSLASPSYIETPSSLASPFSPALLPAETYGIAARREYIRRMVHAGMSGEEFLASIKTHKDSKEAGIHRELDTMLEIQTEVLEAEVQTIVAEAPMTLKRGLPNDEPNPPSKRSCKAPESNFSTPAAPTKSPTVRVMGCPGGTAICTIKQTSVWRNRREYIRHLLLVHLEEYKEGGILKCLHCKDTDFADKKYPLQGSMLGDHIWEEHMTVKEGSKRAQCTAVATKDEAGEPSSTQSGHASDAAPDTMGSYDPSAGDSDSGGPLSATPSGH